MAVELTIEQAKKAPANFMYVWADEAKFLSKLDKKTASIIRAKKANQRKVLSLSAEKYKTTVQAYTDAIRSAFIDYYGTTPAQALVTLANGGEVAGKNWSKGVYGIGAVKRSNFYQNGNVTVDEKTGHIYNNGVDVTSASGVVYGKVKGKAFPISYSAEIDGYTYTSQYSKTAKKYYAGSYSTADGVKQNADGASITASDSASVWESIILSLNQFMQWIISLFAGKTVETINDANTLPSQSDGFVSTGGGMSQANMLLVAAVAVGALLFGGKKNGGKKKSNK